MKNTDLAKQLIFKIIIPIFLGGMIYILFRPTSLYMFAWFKFVGIFEYIQLLRTWTSHLNIADWIVYSLPNGLWLYSFFTLPFIIWKEEINKINFIWFMLPPVLGIGSELGQLFNFLSGTFDISDLLICTFATIFTLLTTDFSFKNKKILNKRYKMSFTFLGYFFFLILASGSNGPADGFQDFVIESEKDPIKKEKLKRREEFYIRNDRNEPNQRQIDSINAVVDSLASKGYFKKEKNLQTEN